MSAEECRRIHGEEQTALIRNYRYALEEALLQAKWMTSQSILVLQALALYLVFASDNSRATWMINGIALGLAQAMGLHSDGSNVGLGAAEVEVRRRVWWTLCQLDVRVSENCGLQPHVPVFVDAQLPKNINDSAILSIRATDVASLTEFTEMTPTLSKIEMAKTSLEFKRSTSDPQARREIVLQQLERYEKTYLKYYDLQNELHRLYYLGTRLLMTRLWKMMYDSGRCALICFFRCHIDL
jgi:hypothetical protein